MLSNILDQLSSLCITTTSEQEFGGLVEGQCETAEIQEQSDASKGPPDISPAFVTDVVARGTAATAAAARGAGVRTLVAGDRVCTALLVGTSTTGVNSNEGPAVN